MLEGKKAIRMIGSKGKKYKKISDVVANSIHEHLKLYYPLTLLSSCIYYTKQLNSYRKQLNLLLNYQQYRSSMCVKCMCEHERLLSNKSNMRTLHPVVTSIFDECQKRHT